MIMSALFTIPDHIKRRNGSQEHIPETTGLFKFGHYIFERFAMRVVSDKFPGMARNFSKIAGRAIGLV